MVPAFKGPTVQRETGINVTMRRTAEHYSKVRALKALEGNWTIRAHDKRH